VKKTIAKKEKKPDKIITEESDVKPIPHHPTPEEVGKMTKKERIAFLHSDPTPSPPPISSGDDELDKLFSSTLKKRFRKN